MMVGFTGDGRRGGERVNGVTERGSGVSATLDEVEAELWRRGLDAAAVDGVLELVRRLAAGGEASASGRRDRPVEAGREGPQLAARQAESRLGARGGRTQPGARPRGEGGSRGSEPRASETVLTDGSGGAAEAARRCRTCRRLLAADRFYRNRRSPTGRRPTCKDCEAVRRLWRHREARRAASLGPTVAEAIERAEREGGAGEGWSAGRGFPPAAVVRRWLPDPIATVTVAATG